jgi:hypothetical protein
VFDSQTTAQPDHGSNDRRPSEPIGESRAASPSRASPAKWKRSSRRSMSWAVTRPSRRSSGSWPDWRAWLVCRAA